MRTVDLLAAAHTNDEDVKNATGLQERHKKDGDRCTGCGQHWPCVPSSIAATMLRTASTRA